jgi:periplasmic divalent cation tolerance protein
MIIKTKTSLFQKIKEIFNKIHPYEVPELLLSPISDGGPEYLKWLAAELEE